MKHLEKHPIKIIKESFKNTDEEILMFFTDYYDKDPDNFIIKNVLVFNNEKIVAETPYMKDVKKYRRAKVVTVKVAKPDGPSSYMSSYLTTIEPLRNILNDLERFYDMSGEEINYKIITDYSGVKIEFLVLGESMSEESSKYSKVNELLEECKELFKKRKFRPSLKGNWLEIRTKSKKNLSRYGDYSVELKTIMSRINNGDLNLQNLIQNNRAFDMIEWRNKVYENGLQISVSGGDHQLVIQLKDQ